METGMKSEVEPFVRRFLASFGASLSELGDGSLEAVLPPSLAGELACEPALRLRFSPGGEQGAGQGEEADSDYLTFGHPLFDRMLELARTRGRAASFLLTAGAEAGFIEAVHRRSPFTGRFDREERTPEHGELVERGPGTRRFQRMLKVTGRLSFPNAKVHIAGRRVVYHPQLLLFFKAALTADEKKEWVIPLLIDSVSEKVERPVATANALPFRPAGEESGQSRTYLVERLYRVACRHLEERLLRRAGLFERQASDRLAKELERIDEYYQGLYEERREPLRKLYRKMASTSIQAGLARSWRGESRLREQLLRLKEGVNALEAERERELAMLAQERERRIEELREKYRVRAEVVLTHGAFVRVPRVEWRLRLTGASRREALLYYDIVRNRLVDWECEACGAPFTGEVRLCRCSALVCEACGSTCSRCEGSACRLCAEAECHVCGAPIGCACDPACPLGLSGLETGPFSVCSPCREAHCAPCSAGTKLFIG